MHAIAAEDLRAAMHYAATTHAREILIESVGLFWILAELIILFFVIAGRDHLENRPASPKFQWSPRWTCRAAMMTAFFLALCAAVYGRGWLWLPVHAQIVEAAEGTVDIQQVQAAFAASCRRHLAVWAAFVAVWVILEILIVCHGWRAYRKLRTLLGLPASGLRMCSSLPVILLLSCLFAARASAATPPGGEGLLAVLQAAYQDDAVYRNAMYLYLRLAGVAWVAVEWVAAVILWRACRMLTDAARRKESSHAA